MAPRRQHAAPLYAPAPGYPVRPGEHEKGRRRLWLTYPPSDHLSPFLQPSELLALSLTCRAMRDAFCWPLQTRVALDGQGQLVSFVDGCLDNADAQVGPTCFFGHPLPHRRCPSPSKSQGRAAKVRHLELHQPGPSRVDFDWVSYEMEKRLLRKEKLNRHTPGGLLGTAVRLTPQLVSLHVYQSSFALTPALAICLATWTPLLRSFHFHSLHTDASSLAFVLQHCRHIEEVDVSGVKSCRCHNKSGAKAALELGAVLQRCSKLKRLVLRASKAACEDNGTLLRLLAHRSTAAEGRRREGRLGVVRSYTADRHRIYRSNGEPAQGCADSSGDEDDEDDESQAPPSLHTLELHRLALPGSALVEFLCSPASSTLTKLFLGGLQKVRASHLSEAVRAVEAASPSCFFNASTPLDLHLDARLLSMTLLRKVGWRVGSLRIYEPKGSLLAEAVRARLLPNLATLVILPVEEDGDLWAEAGTWRRHIQAAVDETMPCRPVDIRIGDEQWKAVVEEKRAIRAHQDHLQREHDHHAAQTKQTALLASLGGAAWNGGPI